MAELEEQNFLDMSDEDFEESDFSADEVTEPSDDTEEEDKVDEILEDTEDDSEDEETGTEEDIPADSTDTDDDGEEESQNSDDESEDTDDSSDEADTETPDEPDYKELYGQLMAPFKANGSDITPGSIEDQRSLMMKGANYELKMRGIKPIRQVQKTLEDAKIITGGNIDSNRLNFLMDINRGDKAAIAALIKESGIDLMDLDTDTDEKFVPNNHMPSEQQVSFDEVVDELSTHENFPVMIDTLTKEWDPDSRQHFYDHPEDLRRLQIDVDNGNFAEINGIIANERVYGRLKDMTNFDAYVHVATSLAEQAKQEQSQDAPTETVVPSTTVTKAKRNNSSRKRAAGSVQSKPASKKGSFNPLTMSDEEFEAAYPD